MLKKIISILIASALLAPPWPPVGAAALRPPAEPWNSQALMPADTQFTEPLDPAARVSSLEDILVCLDHMEKEGRATSDIVRAVGDRLKTDARPWSWQEIETLVLFLMDRDFSTHFPDFLKRFFDLHGFRQWVIRGIALQDHGLFAELSAEKAIRLSGLADGMRLAGFNQMIYIEIDDSRNNVTENDLEFTSPEKDMWVEVKARSADRFSPRYFRHLTDDFNAKLELWASILENSDQYRSAGPMPPKNKAVDLIFALGVSNATPSAIEDARRVLESYLGKTQAGLRERFQSRIRLHVLVFDIPAFKNLIQAAEQAIEPADLKSKPVRIFHEPGYLKSGPIAHRVERVRRELGISQHRAKLLVAGFFSNFQKDIEATQRALEYWLAPERAAAIASEIEALEFEKEPWDTRVQMVTDVLVHRAFLESITPMDPQEFIDAFRKTIPGDFDAQFEIEHPDLAAEFHEHARRILQAA